MIAAPLQGLMLLIRLTQGVALVYAAMPASGRNTTENCLAKIGEFSARDTP